MYSNTKLKIKYGQQFQNAKVYYFPFPIFFNPWIFFKRYTMHKN
jgi:hypothetical protein